MTSQAEGKKLSHRDHGVEESSQRRELIVFRGIIIAHVFSLWSQAKAAGAGANDFFKMAEFG